MRKQVCEQGDHLAGEKWWQLFRISPAPCLRSPSRISLPVGSQRFTGSPRNPRLVSWLLSLQPSATKTPGGGGRLACSQLSMNHLDGKLKPAQIKRSVNFRSGSYSCPKCMTFSPPSGSVGVFKKQTIFIQSPFPSNQTKSIYFPDACEPQPSGCSSTPLEAGREQKHWDHSVGERFWKGNVLIEHGLKDLYHRCRGAERGPAGSVQICFRARYSYRKWGLWLLGGLVSMKQLMHEAADIFPAALLCVFPARVLFSLKLYRQKRGATGWIQI